MQTSFPAPKNRYFKPEDFQNQEVILSFKGWQKKANDDIPAKNGKQAVSWKSRLKYMLRYSYPEYAVDEAGDKIIDAETGEQMKNRNFDPQFPKGYSIEYTFEEGILTCGSLPLFNSFCMCQPSPGDKVSILRTGVDKETKWKVTKAKSLSSVFSEPEYSGDPQINREVNDEDII